MRRHDGMRRAVSGTVAGLAGTTLIQGMQAAGEKWAPRGMPPIRQHPGEFMVQKAEEALPRGAERIPETMEKAAARALGLGYGVAFGLAYAASRRRVGNVIRDGSILGMATWAAGYLGWLPATKLMPPIVRQKPMQVLGAVASHLAFGIATVAIYRALRRRQ